MDKEYAEIPTGAPFLERPPSDYIKEMYYCTQPIEEPERARDLLTMIDLFDGRDQVIYASDWPHHDFDHPRKVMSMPFDAELKRNDHGRNRPPPLQAAGPRSPSPDGPHPRWAGGRRSSPASRCSCSTATSRSPSSALIRRLPRLPQPLPSPAGPRLHGPR